MIRLTDGTMRTCGTEFFGELGDGGAASDDRDVPGPVAALTSGVVQFSIGIFSALATRNDGTVWRWGMSASGSDPTPTPVSGVSTATAVCAGASAIALLSDGTVLPVTGSAGPPVAGITTATAIACGAGGHFLALLADGTVKAWGRNLEGQVGNGAFAAQVTTPATVSGLAGVVAIAGGYNHSLALRNDGTVWTWGANGKGQLGDGSTTNRNLPVLVPSFPSVVRIAGGGDNSMALRSDGVPYVWGSNGFGELGSGTLAVTHSVTPVTVAGLAGVIDMAIGARPDRSTGFAVLADGSVKVWGNNGEGQACIGSSNPLIATPTTVPGVNVN